MPAHRLEGPAMMTSRARLASVSIVCAAALSAGCGLLTSEEAVVETTAEERASTEIEGVENFYGEYRDYATVMGAIEDGAVVAEDLEHPWVAQQDHVDAVGNWDGTMPVYELSPPAGGDHLSVWQTCTGSVYTEPIVDGHAVHSLEHGAVWLTYDPELVDAAEVAALAAKIEGRDYSLMSPYPGQGVPVSLQSWGNRYQTEDPADPDIDAYLDAYILNGAFNPEMNATCAGGVSSPAGAGGEGAGDGGFPGFDPGPFESEEMQELIDGLTEGQ
ncbi:MAG TPA: DUF3105 domain-containing protein [Glycomyces sp.]|nr:DUF3105 domain-containing protein [Glycomyces sp.]